MSEDVKTLEDLKDVVEGTVAALPLTQKLNLLPNQLNQRLMNLVALTQLVSVKMQLPGSG